jgi:hypothetical protein
MSQTSDIDRFLFVIYTVIFDMSEIDSATFASAFFVHRAYDRNSVTGSCPARLATT